MLLERLVKEAPKTTVVFKYFSKWYWGPATNINPLHIQTYYASRIHHKKTFTLFEVNQLQKWCPLHKQNFFLIYHRIHQHTKKLINSLTDTSTRQECNLTLSRNMTWSNNLYMMCQTKKKLVNSLTNVTKLQRKFKHFQVLESEISIYTQYIKAWTSWLKLQQMKSINDE